MCFFLLFFFFRQKTAYEMRISDWSSDVCSSDLWIEALGREVSAPSVKQQLAAVRHLFDWLVTGQVMPTNPAASVRGPAHSVRRGKTPVLAADEARRLLDVIDATTPAGLRYRALLRWMEIGGVLCGESGC